MKNIKQFSPEDLDGNKINVQDIQKVIGNAIYFASADISVCELARKIYREEDFETSEALVESVKNTSRQIAPWLIEQFVAYLEDDK